MTPERNQEIIDGYMTSGKKLSDYIAMIMRLGFMMAFALFAFKYVNTQDSVYINATLWAGIFFSSCLALGMFHQIIMISVFYAMRRFDVPDKIRGSTIFVISVYTIMIVVIFSMFFVLFTQVAKQLGL